MKRVKELDKRVKEKKRSRLQGNKRIEKIHAAGSFSYKGVKMYILIDENDIFNNIFNISPIDAPYVQYMVLQKDGTALIFTQHLLDRYNERVLDKTIGTYKKLIIHLLMHNNIGSLVVDYKETNKIVERIKGGFIYGSRYEGYIVFNTIYDSIEEKDDFFKDIARKVKLMEDTFSKSDAAECNRLYEQFLEDETTEEELRLFLDKKGIIFN